VKTLFALGFACLTVAATSGSAFAKSATDAESETAVDADAEPKGDRADEAAGAEANRDFGHGGQFGLRAALVAGYRMILRYDDSPPCRDPDPGEELPTFCGNAAPLAIDLGLSFAPLDAVEPFVWARFGLASEDESSFVSIDPVLYLGAGVRIYTMSDSAFKFYVEPAVGLGLENAEGPFGDEADLDTELLLHLAAGPHIDLAENFGLYVDGGLTMGILRSINTALELKLGLQGRLP